MGTFYDIHWGFSTGFCAMDGMESYFPGRRENSLLSVRYYNVSDNLFF